MCKFCKNKQSDFKVGERVIYTGYSGEDHTAIVVGFTKHFVKIALSLYGDCILRKAEKLKKIK